MDYPTALERIQRHAGTSKNKPSADDFLQTLFLISDKKGFRPVQPLAENILDCFEVVNVHLNGEQPSEAAAETKAQTLDRALVYAVNNLLTTGRKYAEWVERESGFEVADVQEMSRAVKAIELGWNFVLAGEFDSIRREVANWLE
ncbi:hypothetical protein [Solirubrum puertoriconensis]|uniref:Uncharacterized protein n=1 Tax=Solirubrum puertoriconensis TaxID=1751427 RepID=A0A9X0L6G4_SOLP1|nr:hypothetical protein [Solirubrum puertoriconensis]KUG09711.1 hypothetical protein ASU33_18675 [Solirubrum puertoriconensis]